MEPVIKGHPLHPAIIPIPVGLFPASYILDLTAMLTDNDTLAEAAYYNMLIGALGAAPAALTGFMDWQVMDAKDPAKGMATAHGLLNAGLITLYGLNLLVRRNNKRSKLGLVLSTIGTAGLVASGYLGGEIAYGRGWRVRAAERFELEWQKFHKTGPFSESGKATSTEESFPPEVIKATHELKSGQPVYEEIKNSSIGEEPAATPKSNSRQQGASTKANTKTGPVSGPTDPANRAAATTGATNDNKPSQAEGDRETVNEDLGEPATAAQKENRKAASMPKLPDSKPSQAEGDRNTINADLNDQPPSGPIAQG